VEGRAQAIMSDHVLLLGQSGTLDISCNFFFNPMPPHVLMNFDGLRSGCGVV
jgi:hypothetical protein